MHAPYVRPTRQQLAIVFVLIIGTAVTPRASAQSTRTAVAILAALGTFSPIPPPQETPRCEAASTAVAVRVDSDARRVSVQPYWIDDSPDFDDDALDPAALSPGSGMVVIDSHGRTIASEKPRADPVDIPPIGCCPPSPS